MTRRDFAAIAAAASAPSRTRAGSARTRFYFRADRAINGHIRVGQEVVPVQVLSYRDDIRAQSRDLPGFTEQVRKRGPSFFSPEMLANARRNFAAFPELKQELFQPTRFDGLDANGLWSALPSWNVPRQLYGNWPCPHCGEAIFKTNTFYPWRSAGRYRTECPLCKRVFPSNDILADDYTSGTFPDDGSGWDSGGKGAFDDRNMWVAYAVELAWRGAGIDIQRLALRYALAGDREAAHRACVLLARLAYVYPGMAGGPQPRFKLRRPYKISLEMQFEASLITIPALLAYDLLWDYIATDGLLVEFLSGKDSEIRGSGGVRRLLDVYFVQHLALNFMRRWYHGDNGNWEMQMTRIALAANMSDASNRWLEEVFTHAYNSAANQGGVQDSVLTNYLTREGPTSIGSFHYTRSCLDYLDEIASCLERYPEPKWRSACNLYDDRRWPRLRAMGEAYLDMEVAGRFFPNYGDAGNARLYRQTVIPEHRRFYLNYYRHWPADRLACELAQLPDRRPAAAMRRSYPAELFDCTALPPGILQRRGAHKRIDAGALSGGPRRENTRSRHARAEPGRLSHPR